jgi:4-hydroxythreonine-4-phosphate dehydrogenase
MKTEERIVVGITHGDVNGVGYEIIIKTLMESEISELCTPVVYGSPKLAAYHRKALNIDNFSFNLVKSIDSINLKRPNIIDCVDDTIRIELGRSSPAAGLAAFQSLEKAIVDLKADKIDALVTAPINKYNIQSEQFHFPGHTEFLEQQFPGNEALMLMCAANLRVGVVTGHVALSEVPALIKKNLILKKLRILNQSLIQDFGIRKPTIAVLGLNPHAGDNGLIGKEEIDEIIPALEKARDEKIMALGPYPSDGFFGTGAHQKFDAVLAMYHDQGLTAFKILSFEQGVNFTAGLPIIRTSPAHGTAYDIAGKGVASEESFRQSIYLAIDICRNRRTYSEFSRNSLKTHAVSERNIVDEDIVLTEDNGEIV